MEKKKIIFVIESLSLGGAEKSLVTLLNNLDFEALQVTLLLFNRGGIFEKYIPKEVRVIKGANPRLTLWDRMRYKVGKMLPNQKLHEAQLFWSIAGGKMQALPDHYDVAVAYNQQLVTYYVSEYVSADRKLAWMNTLYKNACYNAVFDFPFFRKFEKIVGVSPEAEASLQEVFSAAGLKIDTFMIKDIIDRRVIEQQSLEQPGVQFKNEVINIVTVCRLAPPKGLSIAIGAAEKLKQAGLRFHWYIVGEGTERPKLESEIAGKNLQDDVTLSGATDNPYPFMRHCDIYVQTSLVEGLGMSVIEAVMLKKPVVCTNFDTAAAIVTPRDLVVKKEASAVADAIKFFIENPDARKRDTEGVSFIDEDKANSLASLNALIHH